MKIKEKQLGKTCWEIFDKMFERMGTTMRKKMRSRWLCLLMVALLAVSLFAGCGKSGSGTAQESASQLATITEGGQEDMEAGPTETGTEDPGGGLAEIEPEILEEEPAEILPEDAAGWQAENEAETGQPGEAEKPETAPALAETDPSENGAEEALPAIDEDGSYTTKEDVALYIHTYGKLPSNFITKKQAEKLGWPGGSLEPYAPGKCIGGNYFGNYEGLLPDGDYRECDIDTLGKKSRGAKRLIYSDDGRIYYTGDHYKSFTQLY